MLQFCCNPNVHILSHFVEGSPNAGKGKKVEINNVDPNSPLRIIDRNRQKTFIKAWWFWNKKRKLGKIDPASSQIWLLTFTSQTQLFCIPISPSQNREKKKKNTSSNNCITVSCEVRIIRHGNRVKRGLLCSSPVSHISCSSLLGTDPELKKIEGKNKLKKKTLPKQVTY